MRQRTLWVLLFLAAARLSAAPPQVTPIVDLRLRAEAFETPVTRESEDRGYEFWNARLRAGADLKWQNVTLHGLLQAAGSFGLPENAAFGAGQALFAANNGETDPTHVGVAELSVAIGDPKKLRLVLGRQGWSEGGELMTGVEYLDGIKRRRMAERLVGNWDWPNVGRRYDGATFGWRAAPAAHLAGFALRPLAGGTNYEEAFEPLDDLNVYGLTLTGPYGTWIPRSDVRLFAIRYEDERPAAFTTAFGPLDIDTYGASLLAGDDRNDLMLWVAGQGGEWGDFDHQAWAAIVEGGHQFQAGALKLVARAGYARASGDDNVTGRHETFYNLLPTNHKFYGGMDYVALANVRSPYVELLVSPGPKWNLRFGVDRFDLDRRTDAFYTGSGPFDDRRLGYTARRPAGGTFRHNDIGTEFDVDWNYTLRKDLRLAVGGGIFQGGAAMEEIFPRDADGSWAYAMLTYTLQPK